jgi:hypothetical protein
LYFSQQTFSKLIQVPHITLSDTVYNQAPAGAVLQTATCFVIAELFARLGKAQIAPKVRRTPMEDHNVTDLPSVKITG